MLTTYTNRGIRMLVSLAALLLSFDASAQTNITGRATDENKQGIPGVNVIVKGTTNGTTTDTDGNFSLSAAPEATLVFSYIGYTTEEVALGGRTSVTVQMAPDIKSLNEVVVVGYGTQEKKDLTGAIASVNAQDIQKLPVAGVDKALQGQVAGLQISSTNGAPGGNTSVLIRGIGSITGGNEPLYVVDGFPVSNAGIGNPLNTINPNDIESVDVLKDASATAIYGSRGSNGVIIITTKRGKEGKARIELDAYAGFQQVTKKIDLLNTADYAQFVIEGRNAGYLDNVANASVNDPNSVRPGSYQIPGVLQGDLSGLPNTDWQDAIFRTAPIQNYQISASGGSEQFRYSVSGGYFNQQGIIIQSGLERYTFRVNLDGKLSDKLSMGVSLLPSFTRQNDVPSDGHYAAYGIVQAAQAMPPYIPLYNPDGTYGDLTQPTEGQVVIQNPVRIANELTSRNTQFRFFGNAYAEYAFLPDLKLRVTVGTDVNYYKNRTWRPSTVIVGSPSEAVAYNQEQTNWLNENTLSYKKSFNNHSIDALAGFTAQRAYSDRLDAIANNFPDNLIDNVNGGVVSAGGEDIQAYTILSLLARVNYAFRDKYLVTATLRRDGSSRFGQDNRWGSFPSASLGWRVSEEGFMQGLNAVNDLKLRASYGLTGNNAIGNYRAIGQLSDANYVIGDVLTPGLARASFTNDNLGWETMRQLDIGLDLAVLNSRVALTADYYRKVNTDMLFTIQTPAATGLTSAVVNLGKVENKGIELALSTRNLVGAFKWTTTANITFNRNEVLAMSSDAERIFGSAGGRPAFAVTQVGSPIGTFYGRKFDGIFLNAQEAADYAAQPAAKAGDVRWVDVDANGVINDDDRTLLGSPHPDYFFGFNNTFSWKGFTLDILTNGMVGQQIYNTSFLLNLSAVQNNAQYFFDRRYVSEAQPGDGRWNRVIRGGRNNNTAFSDQFLFDGSFWRIRNVTLSYALPATLTERLRLGSARIYATATNLYTFTSYFGYDPEVSIGGDNQTAFGLDFGAYPQARTITFGVNLGF